MSRAKVYCAVLRWLCAWVESEFVAPGPWWELWGSGGRAGREFRILTGWWGKQNSFWACWLWPRVSYPMAAGWRDCEMGGWGRLHSWWVCGWGGGVKCPEGREERHQGSSQLFWWCAAGSCGRRRCRRRTTRWVPLQKEYIMRVGALSRLRLRRKSLLGFLGQWCGVDLPGQVLGDVSTKILQFYPDACAY